MKILTNVKLLLMYAAISTLTFSCGGDDDDSGATAPPPPAPTYNLFATSDTAGGGDIISYDVTNLGNVTSKSFSTATSYADGVYYDRNANTAFITDAVFGTLNAYDNFSVYPDGSIATPSARSGEVMYDPKELAVKDDYYVVAEAGSGNGEFYIFQRSGVQFILRNEITTNFEVWGITFIGDDLYAAVDNTGKVAKFTNFLLNTTNTTVNASKIVDIDGVSTARGITYEDGILLLTDAGSTDDAVPTFNTDGGIHIISDFLTKFNAASPNGSIAASNQIVIKGSNTMLGDPVDVTYDPATKNVYVAEAVNDRILGFGNVTAGGNLTPIMTEPLNSASAVHFSK